ncbi:MAG: hypothetical protein EB023_06565 [Flavobacteriia bacterium]|nr:hypothetical protein [Flavobacteriia bacterium]
MNDVTPNPPKKVELGKVLIYSLVAIVVLGLIGLLIKGIVDQQKSNEKQAKAFKEQMKELKLEIKTISNKYTNMTQNRDSLQTIVNYYQPMRAVVYNAKLRDRVMDGLDFKPGDVARFKVDSTTAVIVEIKVGGNDLNYYVNYLVKNRKGLLVEVSPFELFKP